MRECLASRTKLSCHPEPFGFAQDKIREGSPVDLSRMAQVHRDASLPSVVQYDMLFLILDTPVNDQNPERVSETGVFCTLSRHAMLRNEWVYNPEEIIRS